MIRAREARRGEARARGRSGSAGPGATAGIGGTRRRPVRAQRRGGGSNQPGVPAARSSGAGGGPEGTGGGDSRGDGESGEEERAGGRRGRRPALRQPRPHGPLPAVARLLASAPGADSGRAPWRSAGKAGPCPPASPDPSGWRRWHAG